MKNEDMNTFIENLRKKLGDETSANISEELTQIINENTQMNASIEDLTTKNQALTTDKENLLKTNGSLLQQISSQPINNDKKDPETEEETKISIDDIFDEKGNFKNN